MYIAYSVRRAHEDRKDLSMYTISQVCMIIRIIIMTTSSSPLPPLPHSLREIGHNSDPFPLAITVDTTKHCSHQTVSQLYIIRA